MSRCFYRLLSVAAVLLSVPAVGHAQGFTESDYRLDLYNGPVTGSGRMVGLGGAYTAIATGIDGAALNPAGYAERSEQEISAFEWELSGGIWLGGLFGNYDYDNNGSSGLSYTDGLQFTVGARLQYANTGGGFNIRVQSFELRDEAAGRVADVELITLRTGAAYALHDWVLGASLILGSVQVLEAAPPRAPLAELSGPGAELGMLYRPEGKRHRIGFTGRTPITQNVVPVTGGDELDDMGDTAGGDDGLQGLILPKQVVVPWEVAAGFAFQFGERYPNPRWQHTAALKRRLQAEIAAGTYEPPPPIWGADYKPLPDDPRKALRVAMANDREYRHRYLHAQPRRYLLLSTDVVLIGRVKDGQGLEAFLTQTPQTSGKRTSVSVRAGIESEVLNDLVRVRGGGYLEPSRFKESRYRPHATLGGDVHLFDLWDWAFRGTFAIDVAPRYFDWGLAIGFWH